MLCCYSNVTFENRIDQESFFLQGSSCFFFAAVVEWADKRVCVYLARMNLKEQLPEVKLILHRASIALWAHYHPIDIYTQSCFAQLWMSVWTHLRFLRMCVWAPSFSCTHVHTRDDWYSRALLLVHKASHRAVRRTLSRTVGWKINQQRGCCWWNFFSFWVWDKFSVAGEKLRRNDRNHYDAATLK